MTIHERRIIPESIRFLDIYVHKKPIKLHVRRSIVSGRLSKLHVWQGGLMTSESTSFEHPIRVSLRPSNYVIAAIILIHLGALLCIHLARMPAQLILLLCFIILLSFARCYFSFIYQAGILRSGCVPAELLLNAQDEWFLTDVSGAMNLVTLLPESYVHHLLVVLNFQQGSHKRSVILTADTVPADTFRRLRVRLKFTLVGSGSGR